MKLHGHTLLWAAAVVLTGGVLAFLVTGWLHAQQAAEAAQRFSELGRRATDRLARRMQIYEYGLRGMRGAIIAQGAGYIRRSRVIAYSQSREQQREFPGSRGYGFIRRVPADQEAAFIEKARLDGKPGFQTHRLAPHDGERLIIQYIEPETQNEESLGLDIASETNRRNAAYEAMASGQPVLTHPITLLQASGNIQQGFLLLLAVYDDEFIPNETDDRTPHAYGLAFTPLLFEEILANFDFSGGEFSLAVRDLDDNGSSLKFYDSAPDTSPAGGLVQHNRLDLFGRHWSVEVRAQPRFLTNLNQTAPEKTGGEILGGSVLLAGLIYIYLQVDERKRENRRVQARLAAIVSSANDAIIGLNLGGIITDWNTAACNIFGYSAETAIGSSLAALTESRGSTGETTELLEKALRKGVVTHVATQRRRADDIEFHVSLTVSPIRDGRGQITGAAMTIRDISAEKASEKRILELNATLERRVLERTASLESAVRELADFSYLASHDLRTPLRAIDGFSSLLQREPDCPAEQAQDYLRRIRAAAQRMGRIIDDMVDLSRISRSAMQRETIDLSRMAATIIAQMRAIEPRRRVEVRIQPGLLAHADAELMRVALTQLLDNAWKFTRETPQAVIEISCDSHLRPPIFHVRDNGIGFDMSYVNKLFSAFQRLHTSDAYDGSGIGLAMVQRIVRKHGGEVWAEGAPEHGAVFHFSLPD